MAFEIQELTVFDGWINNWISIDESGEAQFVTFDTRNLAQIELDMYFHDLKQAMAEGFMDDLPKRENYRIVEVTA